MKLDICYFTGTGNSWWAARRLADMAGKDGLTARVRPVTASWEPKEFSPAHHDLLGFAYPTHGFCLPWRMLKFFLALPRCRARFFLINNRAGMKFGRVFTPGISGLAVLLPLLILILKGYRPVGALPLDTPSNWVAVHPGLSPGAVTAIMERRERDLEKLWKKMSGGHGSFPFKFWVMLPLDILVSPVSVGYMAFGRFLLTATYFADAGCDGCGLCASQCPVGAIRIIRGRPLWTIRCESCMRCLNVCPHRSAHCSLLLAGLYSWGLFWLTGFSGPLGFAWKAMSRLAGDLSDLLLYPAWWLLTVALAWLLGRLVFFLNRFKALSWLWAVTTPMHFWRRYLAPGFLQRRSVHDSAGMDSKGSL